MNENPTYMIAQNEAPAFIATQKVLSRLNQFDQDVPPTSLAKYPQFEEKTVTQAVERALGISQVKQDALHRLFGNKLGALKLTVPETDEEKGVTNIFESLLASVFDEGTSIDRECKVPGYSEVYVETACPTLNRSAFITRVLQEHDRQNKMQAKGQQYDISIGLIDLKNIRGADFEIEGQKDKPADVLINKAARAIRDAFKALGYANKELILQGKSWEVGRYGGDEFVITLFGNFDPEAKAALYEEIQKQLALPENKGYYQYQYIEEDGHIRTEVKYEKMQLKEDSQGNVVELVEFPEGGEVSTLQNRKIIFKEYLERGLLLTNNEFEKVLKKYSPQDHLDMDLYRKDYPKTASNYPLGVITTEQKIAHIQKHHPELSFYFDLAKSMDNEDFMNPLKDYRQLILLETLENSIFDRLIGEAIYSRDQFQNYLKDKEFDSVITLDLKFIKELNEKTTYADADMAIKSLWKSINSSLTSEDREKIIVGRFGGTFMLGVRKGTTIPEDTLRKLKGINEMQLTFGENSFMVPIGNSTIDNITEHEDRLQDSTPNATFKSIVAKTEEDFYDKIMVDIITEDLLGEKGAFIESLVKSDIAELSTEDGISKVDIYALFLRGKRKVERINKLLSANRIKGSDPRLNLSTNINRLCELVKNSIGLLSDTMTIDPNLADDRLKIYERVELLSNSLRHA